MMFLLACKVNLPINVSEAYIVSRSFHRHSHESGNLLFLYKVIFSSDFRCIKLFERLTQTDFMFSY